MLKNPTCFYRHSVRLAALLGLFPFAPVVSADQLRTIALTGTYAAAVEDGLTLVEVGRPTINDAGQVVFSAQLEGPTVSDANDSVLYNTLGDGSLSVIAREGDEVPGAEGAVFGRSGAAFFRFTHLRSAFTRNQEVVITTTLAGPDVDTSNDAVLVRADSGAGLTLLAREGSPLSSGPAGTMYSDHFGNPVINSNGTVLTRAILQGGATVGIVRFPRGEDAEVLAADGLPPSGIGGGAGWSSFSDTVALNSAGVAAFYSSIEGPAVDLSNNDALYLRRPGRDPVLIAREGDPAPQTAAGVVFSEPSVPRINDSDRAVFTTRLVGPGVNSQNNNAIYRTDGSGAPTLVARGGNPAPGFADGVDIRTLSSPVINATNSVAYFASVTGPGISFRNDDAVYVQSGSGTPELIVRAGDAVGDPADGLFFGSPFSVLGGAVLNGRGQLAISAYVRESPQSLPGHASILAQDDQGQLQVIAMEGGLLNVSDIPNAPDFRVVDRLGFTDGSGNQDGLASAFNDAGELAFYASFTDGTSGVFVASVNLVPEPASLFLVATLGLSPLLRRHRAP